MNAMNLLNVVCGASRGSLPCFPRGRRPEAHRPRPRAMDRFSTCPVRWWCSSGSREVLGAAPGAAMATALCRADAARCRRPPARSWPHATGFHLRADERVNASRRDYGRVSPPSSRSGRWHLVAPPRNATLHRGSGRRPGRAGTCGHHQSHVLFSPPVNEGLLPKLDDRLSWPWRSLPLV